MYIQELLEAEYQQMLLEDEGFEDDEFVDVGHDEIEEINAMEVETWL